MIHSKAHLESQIQLVASSQPNPPREQKVQFLLSGKLLGRKASATPKALKLVSKSDQTNEKHLLENKNKKVNQSEQL
jgi:hypothetical protein